MSEINLGQISLTGKQLSRLSDAHLSGVRGYFYKDGELSVNHEKDVLSDVEKTEILNAVNAIPDDLTDKEKRLNELKLKPVLTLPEVTEILRIHGLA